MDESLEHLVAEFLERREAGEEISPDEFAASHPDKREALKEQLERADRVADMFPDPATTPLRVIGDWNVVRELGRGGSGRVFEVTPAGGGPRRALKLLNTAAALDPRQDERFRREARILRTFAHPGAVRVHDVGQHGGCPFLVMDHVSGRSLASVIAEAHQGDATDSAAADRLSLPGDGPGAGRAARLVATLARTIAAAHRAGLVHRDIKPSNVLLTDDGEPVAIDFGLASADGAATLTGTGDVLGTPHFMAPEQAAGSAGDHRVDVYGLGAVLYQLLTLQVPHRGGDPLSVLHSARRVPPRPPRVVDSSIPRGLDAIVRRAMAFRPTRRFATAEALADALEAFGRGETGPRSSYPRSARVEDWWRWHRGRVTGLAGIVLFGITVWAIVVARGSERAQEAMALVQRASAARLDGHDDRAERLARQALELTSSPTASYLAGANAAELGAAAAVLAGDRHTAAERHRDAMLAYREARSSGLDGSLIAGLEGLAAAAAGEREIALRELTVAARAFPEVATLHEALGTTYSAREQWGEAADALQAAARLENDAQLWHRSAICGLKTPDGDREKALFAVSKALELAGTDPPPEFRRTLAAAVDPPEKAIRILTGLVAH